MKDSTRTQTYANMQTDLEVEKTRGLTTAKQLEVWMRTAHSLSGLTSPQSYPPLNKCSHASVTGMFNRWTPAGLDADLIDQIDSPPSVWQSILNGPGNQEVTLDPAYGNPYSAARGEDIEKDDFSNRVNHYMSNRWTPAGLDADLIDQIDNFMQSLNDRVNDISERDKQIGYVPPVHEWSSTQTMCPADLSLSILLSDPATAIEQVDVGIQTAPTVQESHTPSSIASKLKANALAREAYKQRGKPLEEPSVARQAVSQRSSVSAVFTVSWPSIQTYADLKNQGTDGPYYVLDATADGVEEGVSALYTWIVPDGCLDRQGYWKRICCFVGLNHKVVPADYCRKKPADPYQVKAFIDTYTG